MYVLLKNITKLINNLLKIRLHFCVFITKNKII